MTFVISRWQRMKVIGVQTIELVSTFAGEEPYLTTHACDVSSTQKVRIKPFLKKPPKNSCARISESTIAQNIPVNLYPFPSTPVPALADPLRSSAAATKARMHISTEAGMDARKHASVMSAKKNAIR